MVRLQRFIACLLTIVCLLPSVGRADDIELYMINPTISADRPNVLIFVDNTSNWSTYFANEVSALSSLLSGLSDQFNVGIMMFSKSNDPANGGYVRAAIRQMTGVNRPLYASMVTAFDSNSDQSNSTTPYGRAMMEAWYYFNGMSAVGGLGAASRDYPSNASRTTADAAVHALTYNAFSSSASSTYLNTFLVDASCQKNFIIFISNGHPSTAEKNDSVPGDALTTAGGSASTTDPAISGSMSWNVMDNWAKFMSSHAVTGKPHIYSYAVAVDPDSWPIGTRSDTVSLLQSTGKLGKGGYYSVSGTAASILEALNDIFQKIISVNSIFASVTLPVNVNVKGQFLNQVYMGVFRPDASASPRWPGNLKEYRMELQSDGTPIMVGRTSGQKIYDDTTGFVTTTATSFWTTETTANITKLDTATNLYSFGAYKFWDSTYYPDAQGAGVPPDGTRDGTADAPDGEMVEKGGAAQRLRGTYSYNYDSLTARVPNRNVYTCTGAGCGTAGTALSSMPFNTSNAALTTTVFGIEGSATITSLTRGNSTCSGTTCTSVVTATTDTAHGLGDQASATISGSSVGTFNGVVVVTVTGANTFTYQVTETPAPTASGTITVTPNGTVTTSVSAVSYSDSGSTRTVTLTSSGHGLTVGSTVSANVTGITPSNYSGTQSLLVVDANTLQYTVTITTGENPGSTTYSSPYPVATFYNNSSCTGTPAGSANIGSVTRTAGTGNLTVAFSTSSTKTPNATYIRVSLDSSTAYPGCYTCSSGDNTNCKKNSNNSLHLTGASYTTSTTPSVPVLGAGTVSAVGTARSVTALSRGGSSCTSDPCRATVTASVSSVSGITAGSSVTIAGASPSNYNGSFTVASVGTGQFTYTIDTTPARDATGGTVSSSTTGISKDDLINWVRGQNVKGEDNPSELDADVRGYLHGDVLHSQPAVINYNRSGITSDVVVYYGANDGMLHAIKGGRADTDGAEKWSFVAPEHFSYFQRMYANTPLWSSTAPRTYFFDGPITTFIKAITDADGNDRISGTGAEAYIFAGMRRGGRAYYALDVTDPDAPAFQWKIVGGSGDFTELGYTWSSAKVSKISITSDTTTVAEDVVVFGGGYDPTRDSSGSTANDKFPQGTITMGRAIYIVRARTGELIWSASPAVDSATNKQVTGMTCSFAADVFVMDSDSNGYADRLYAVDTCGNVWRANIGDASTANWTIAKIFSLSDATGNPRKFLYQPSVVRETDYDILLIGSGDREHPFDYTTANRFYALWDDKATNAMLPASAYTEADLCDFTNLTITNGAPVCSCSWPTSRGWYISFESCAGEKTVGGAVTVAGVTIFSTNVPPGSSCITTDDGAANQCSAGLGLGRDYAIYYDAGLCGKPFSDTDADGVLEASDRFTKNNAGGFAPTGTPVTTVDDNGNFIPPTICIGMNCFKITEPPSTRRKRVFWQMGIDNR